MINTDAFATRLREVIDYYAESASSFAEKIGVQRSSISHILSGRNKPSLEFVLKILAVYPEVDLFWLLNGKGTFPIINKKESNHAKQLSIEIPEPEIEKPKEKLSPIINTDSDKSINIERIVIFYTDGTFKNFQN